MRTISNSVPKNTPATTPAYSPSVPLTVYRELAAELQTTQTKLNALTGKNQQLQGENQHLRQEIAKAVQSILHLQKVVDSYTAASLNQIPLAACNVKTETSPPQETHSPSPVADSVQENFFPMSEQVYIEEQEVSYYSDSKPKPKQLNSWWLILSLLFIVITAFGTGYLIVRPFFENHSR